MDIEKLIERLRNNNIENNCHDCALGYYAFEAATAIETLRADLARVTAERDVAIRDIYSGNANDCDTCVHGCDYDDDCPVIIGADCEYQWRGLKWED